MTSTPPPAYEQLDKVVHAQPRTYLILGDLDFVTRIDEQAIRSPARKLKKKACHVHGDSPVPQTSAALAQGPRDRRQSRKALFIFIVVIGLAAVCTVIGVVLHEIASENNNSSSADATYPTRVAPAGVTTSTSTPTPTGGIGVENCPAANGSLYQSSKLPYTTFEIVCNRDQPDGVLGVNGGFVVDLDNGIVAYSIEACIELCVNSTNAGNKCTAVTYGANITLALSRPGITGNCFLKSQRALNLTIDNSGQCISAFVNQ